MGSKILTIVLGVLIDKLLLPFLSQLGKRIKSAGEMKDKIETNRKKVQANVDAKETDEVRDTFGRMP